MKLKKFLGYTTGRSAWGFKKSDITGFTGADFGLSRRRRRRKGFRSAIKRAMRN